MPDIAAHKRSTALEHMQRKIDELPLLPQALVKLLQLNRSSDDYFDEFERQGRPDLCRPRHCTREFGHVLPGVADYHHSRCNHPDGGSHDQ